MITPEPSRTPLPLPRRANILLVDDTPAKLAALEAVLAPLEQNVVTATSGREALRAMLRQDYAVVLLDVRMSDMDGFEVADLIRRRSRSEHTPIIFLTAFDKAEVDMTQGYSLGAVDFVFSPIRPDVLRAKVQVFVELHLQAAAIRDLYIQAQEGSRAKSEFLNLAAHELRTPLSVITGYLSMLREGSLGAPPKGWDLPLGMLAGKADELNKIVNDLLLASRLDVGGRQPERQLFDARDAAREAVERAAARARLRQGTLKLTAGDEVVPLEADVDGIARILDNLINNAMTYCVRNPEIQVEVIGGSPVRFRVSDNGVGIPPERREDIFDRFVRLDDPAIGPVPGTGLGLYISRQLARHHGGELLLEHSEHGAGSTFTMTLPLADRLPAPKPKAEAETEPEKAASQSEAGAAGAKGSKQARSA